MDRRDFVGRVGRVTAGLGALPLFGAEGAADERAIPRRTTLAAVGDCIITRKLRMRDDPAFTDLVDILREADATWANCEMTFGDEDALHPTPKGTDMNLICPPWGADELAWLGVDFMGTANNHTKDYGRGGLMSTIRELERVGIAHAGAAENLQEAARPGYVDTPGGRLAQVNTASTFPDWSQAAPMHAHVNGRAGLNPLNVEWTYQVEESLLEELRETRTELARKRGSYDEDDEEEQEAGEDLEFLGRQFAGGDATDIHSEGRREDVDRIIGDGVEIGDRNARLTVVTIHAHESYESDDRPAQFLQPFARACIDAGADAFIGAGPHLLRGVEMYRGKPIFYSLGNFLFQYESVQQIPAEVYHARDFDIHTLDPMLTYEKFDFPDDRRYWESVVPVITYEGEGDVVDIRLHPVTLGQDEPPYSRGTPVLADMETGREILERLAMLSEPYGTTIELDGGVGRVRS